MNEPIVFTMSQLLTAIVWVAGAIIAVDGARAAIAKLVGHIKSPELKQDEQIQEHERRLNVHEDRLNEHDQWFKSDKLRLEQMNQATSDTNKIIIRSLQALTENALHGNNKEQLELSSDELNNFLRDKL